MMTDQQLFNRVACGLIANGTPVPVKSLLGQDAPENIYQISFLPELQWIADNVAPDDWPVALAVAANSYGLNIPWEGPSNNTFTEQEIFDHISYWMWAYQKKVGAAAHSLPKWSSASCRKPSVRSFWSTAFYVSPTELSRMIGLWPWLRKSVDCRKD